MAGKTEGSTTTPRSRLRRRVPLGDGQSTANVNANANVPKIDAKEESPIKLDKAVPKNESLVGNGTYAVRHTISLPKNKRVSQISETAEDSKRNSAISTASTNASGTGRKRKTHIGPWQLGATVGKGGTARVRKVKHSVTGQLGVAKIIPVAVAERARAISLANLVRSAEDGDPTLDFGKQIPLGLEREIAIMKLLKHPNIVRLYDVWENRNEIYLIMEFVEGGELFEYVADRQKLGEDVTVFLFRQIIWALKYCHGLNIHHRDLKPENILLDFEFMTVKLVDFGMAALQPEGNFLTTPCGSPHYAAPELLVNRPYDGGQADVWSAGVVLFVMLTGYPPFNFPPDPQGVVPEDHKLKGLFRAITRAEYRMPGFLSADAQDLLRKIFIADPRRRITIDEVWAHPLLHKYDAIWGMNAIQPSDSMIQLALAQDNWKALRPRSIDREIFRALRTLWHSESDTALTDKLCNKDFNQEKFFYHTMLRYRDENLENMQSSQNSFGYSASDYQHSKAAPPVPPLPTDDASKRHSGQSTMSKFSITGDEHLLSKHSYYDLPVSEASYDPFRASRSPIVPKTDPTTTVHRLDSKGGKKRISRASRGNSLRVDVLRGHNRRASHVSSKHSSGSTSLRRGMTNKRSSKSSSSRLSTTSSYMLNASPMPVMRPSELHKRGVQFSHVRRSSTGSALSSGASAHTPDHRARALRKLASRRSSSFLTASPPASIRPIVVQKKSAAVQPTPRTKKVADRAELEARKVSAELGKVCDEAFWRSSMSSSFHTGSLSSAEKQFVETPPSSISRPSPHFGLRDPFYVSESMRNRPLPPTPMVTKSTLHPMETPVTYTAREIAEMRDRLAVKYAREGTGNQKYFNDVLRQLDNLMKPIEETDDAIDSRRIVSAPPDCHYLKASLELNPLDSIPEEGKPIEESYTPNPGVGNTQISRGLGRVRGVDRGTEETIRVVAPSPPANTFGIKAQHLHLGPHRDLTTSPLTPQPLKIRKNSSSTNSSESPSNTEEMGQNISKLKGKVEGDHTLGHYNIQISRKDPKKKKKQPTPEENPPKYEPELPDDGAKRNSYWHLYEPDTTAGASAPKRSSREFGMDSPLRQGITSNPVYPPELSAGIEEPTWPSEPLQPVPEDQPITEYNNGRVALGVSMKPINLAEIESISTAAPKGERHDERFKRLDDREESRREREVGNRSERGGLAKFFQKITKKSAKNEPVYDAALSGPSNYQALKAFTGQKQIGPEQQAANFVTGWQGWMRKKGFLPGIMKPAIVLVASSESRSHVWEHMHYYLFNDDIGIEQLKDDFKTFTMTIKVHSKVDKDLRKDVVVDVEMFSISMYGRPIGRCVIRLVQRAGPVDCVLYVGRLLQDWLVNQDLHMRDLEEAEEMKEVLMRRPLGERPTPRQSLSRDNSFPSYRQ